MEPSMLERVFANWVNYELPALYQLFEITFMALGLYHFLSAFFLAAKVRSINGVYNSMSFQMTDVSVVHVITKIFAGVFLMNYGAGQAVISNSLFASHDFEPYSIETFRTISCSLGSASGCLHYDLGLFQGESWRDQIINVNFFNIFTGFIQLIGSFFYGKGWLSLAKVGDRTSGKPPVSIFAFLAQVGLGALCMHPLQFYQMLA